MAQIDIQTQEGYCYFSPFKPTYDFDDYTRDAGVSAYRRSWWGWLLSWLGWSASLKGSNGKIHYVSRKELDRWIERHKGPKEGDYHERIAEICKRFVEENRDRLGGEKLRELHQQIRSKVLKEKAKVHVDRYVAALKAKVEETKIREKDEELNGLEERRENNTFKIVIAGRTIIANPDRMATSRYFKHFLDFKENINRFVRVHLERLPGIISEVRSSYGWNSESITVDGQSFKKDPVDYTIENIEIDGDAFEILKVYLEGKTEVKKTEKKDPYEKLDQCIKESHSIGKELKVPSAVFDVLEKYDCIDLPHLMEFIYKRDHGDSEGTIEWNEREIPVDEFLPALETELGEGEDFAILRAFLEKKSGIQPDQDQDAENEAVQVKEPKGKEEEIEQSEDAQDSAQTEEAQEDEIDEEGLLDGEKEIAPLLTPEVIEGLYKLHQIIDISGIMEIVYKNIDFYSDETINWKGQFIPQYEFWPALAREFGDTELDRLCQEKYSEGHLVQVFIDSRYRGCAMQQTPHVWNGFYNESQAARAAKAAPIKCSYHSDGSLKLTLQYLYNNTALQGLVDYFKEPFSFPSLLSETVKEKVRSIVIDVTSLATARSQYSNYSATVNPLDPIIQQNFNYLLRSAHTDLTIGTNQTELIVQGALYTFSVSQDLLPRLLEKYSRITFSNLPFWSDPLRTALFQCLSVEGVKLEASLQTANTPHTLSITVQTSPKSEKSLTVSLDQNSFDLGAVAWLPEDFHLIIDQKGGSSLDKKSWAGTNLSLIKAKKLTIKNAALNQSFANEVKKLQLDSLNMESCTFIECEEELREISSRLQEEQTRLQEEQHQLKRIQEAIDLNTQECTEGPFNEIRRPTVESCKIVQNGSELVFSFKIDAEYIRWYFLSSHFRKRFSLLEHLKRQEIADAGLSSIVLDFSQLMMDLESHKKIALDRVKDATKGEVPQFISVDSETEVETKVEYETLNALTYLRVLLRDLDEHLIHHDLPIEIRGIPETSLKEDEIVESLRKLLLSGRSLVFDFGIDSDTIIEALYPLLETKGYALKVHLTPDSEKVTLAFTESDKWEIQSHIEGNQDREGLKMVKKFNGFDAAKDNRELIASLKSYLAANESLSLHVDGIKEMQVLLPLLKEEGYALEANYSAKSQKLTLAFIECDEWSIKLRVDDFQNLEELRGVQHPIHLILHYPQLQPWDCLNLHQLLVSELTIENAELNDNFIQQMAFSDLVEHELQNLTTLTFSNCEIDSEFQERIEENFMCRNALKGDHEPERVWLVK